jgi:hypothetical protein
VKDSSAPAARLAEALGFDPESVLVAEPGLLLDPRFLASLHRDLVSDLGEADAGHILLQIGLLHGLRDAARVLGSELGRGGEPEVMPAPPMAIRFRSNPDASPPGALEIHGCWPERSEASARLSALGVPSAAVACWLSAGYTSGWLSGVFEADILARETSCSASGAESCRFVAREADGWRACGDAETAEVVEAMPFAELRDLVGRHAPPPSPTSAAVDPQEAAVHIWGPVMVIPFSGADEALLALELIGRDPGAAEVSVVVIDLTGAVIDEAFGAAALEQIVERVESWNIEAVFAGVSPLSQPVVSDLSRPPLLVEKDLQAAIASAFQIAESQRRAV